MQTETLNNDQDQTRDPGAIVELDPAQVSFALREHQLWMQPDGSEAQAVTLVLLFPLSNPDEWIAVLDSQDEEIGLIRALGRFSTDSQAAIREHLWRRYQIPQIQQILACQRKMGFCHWTVRTDRGITRFTSRPLREIERQPVGRHIILTDLHGNRYDIPDLLRLDQASQRIYQSLG